MVWRRWDCLVEGGGRERCDEEGEFSSGEIPRGLFLERERGVVLNTISKTVKQENQAKRKIQRLRTVWNAAYKEANKEEEEKEEREHNDLLIRSFLCE